MSCIACAKGFYGAECVIKCPYPAFGQACQSVCVCSVGYCDHVNGCTQSVGSMILHHVFFLIRNFIICSKSKHTIVL